MKKLFYGPGDWLATRFNARQRRALAAWILIWTIFPGMPLWFVLRHALWFVGFISMVALSLAMWGVVSAETPVESETEK